MLPLDRQKLRFPPDAQEQPFTTLPLGEYLALVLAQNALDLPTHWDLLRRRLYDLRADLLIFRAPPRRRLVIYRLAITTRRDKNTGQLFAKLIFGG